MRIKPIQRYLGDGKPVASIKKWPETERPRERMQLKGPEALSNTELLAILIGHGQKGRTALDVARHVLAEAQREGRTLGDIDLAFLQRIPSVGSAKACRLMAGIELARRLLETGKEEFERIVSKEGVLKLLRPRFYWKQVEIFFAVFVDVKNRPMLIQEIARGSSEAVSFLPKEVFQAGVRIGASGVICAHNHPSGDVTPSSEDGQLTRRLQECARILGIRFLDHLVLTERDAYSFAENGWT